jgi:hypothetical protein
MTVSRDGSKLLENCIKMLSSFKNKKIKKILEKIVNLPTNQTNSGNG